MEVSGLNSARYRFLPFFTNFCLLSSPSPVNLTYTSRSRTPGWLALTRSQTPRWLTLRGVSELVFFYPKVNNTKRSRTLHKLTLCGVLPASILSLQASPCLEKEYEILKKLYVNYFRIDKFFCYLFNGLACKQSLTLFKLTLCGIEFFCLR